ncbi:LEPR-XLL domain-containing protein [Herbiconiux sp. SALV-R1]|nr:LEPR-XLL domain-containing protein [Herbiconiux sp. SALV-R1]
MGVPVPPRGEVAGVAQHAVGAPGHQVGCSGGDDLTASGAGVLLHRGGTRHRLHVPLAGAPLFDALPPRDHAVEPRLLLAASPAGAAAGSVAAGHAPSLRASSRAAAETDARSSGRRNRRSAAAATPPGRA